MTVAHRSSLSQEQKRKSFAKAFQTISLHRENGNLLSAFVVAFSIFEDRLTAADILSARISSAQEPTGFHRLHTRINRLVAAERISEPIANSWKLAGNDRNVLLHAAMWDVDAVSDAQVAGIIALARQADALAAKLRRAAGRLAEK